MKFPKGCPLWLFDITMFIFLIILGGLVCLNIEAFTTIVSHT